jgi:hypothetical protein
MAKNFFINNLNTFIGQALLEEIRNDVGEDGEANDDANRIFATFIDKDSSDKPQGIAKMLKVITVFILCLEVQAETGHDLLEWRAGQQRGRR